jgi:transcriptional regulator with XRE-family HTH domain
MERGNDWSVRVAHDVGKRVAYYRRRADLTAVMLSARCAGHGLPLDRGTIAKLETGHRNSVTVDEVFVLAAALEVPPVQLLAGTGMEESTEVLPGRHVPAFRAAEWVSGEGPLPEPADDPGAVTITELRYPPAAHPLMFHRRADQVFEDEMRFTSRARVMEESASVAGTPEMRAALTGRAGDYRRAADQARTERENLRKEAEAEGILPPPDRMSLRPPGDTLII